MTIPAVAPLYETVRAVQNLNANCRSQATAVQATYQATGANTADIYSFIDSMNRIMATYGTLKNVAGLDAYATTVIPNYAGTMTADILAITNAGLACNNWVFTNFPRDGVSGYLLAEILNSDCTRTPRHFTPANLAPLTTLIGAFIAALG